MGRGADGRPLADLGDFAAEVRERREAPASAVDSPATTAELGSFVPAPPRAAGPIDAVNFTIGKAPAAGLATAESPRYTP